MHRLRTTFLLSFLLVTTGCGLFRKSAPIDVVLVLDQSGMRHDVFPIFDITGTALFGAVPTDVVKLDSPSEELDPSVFFDRGGRFVVVSAANGDTITEATSYGQLMHQTVGTGEAARTVVLLARRGTAERSFGAAGSEVWSVSGKQQEHLGQLSYQNGTTPQATPRTVRAFRARGDGQKWVTSIGHQILALEPDGKLKQVGWVGWRKIAVPGGKHLAVLMTKGMEADARWAGRYNGKLYRDR